MLFDHKGQSLTEYVIALAAVLAIASIVAGVFTAIGRAWERQGRKIDALP